MRKRDPRPGQPDPAFVTRLRDDLERRLACPCHSATFTLAARSSSIRAWARCRRSPASPSASPAVMSDVAATVRRLRQARGLSADQLATRAGVSKGALVALENATANPDLATLVRLADALAVPVSALVERRAARRVMVSDAAQAQPLWHGPAGGTARLVVTTRTAAPVELWRWELPAGERYDSHPHAAGVAETVTVISGAAVVTVDGTDYPLTAGQTVTYAADVAHGYRGEAPGADLLMTVHLPAPAPKGRAQKQAGT